MYSLLQRLAAAVLTTALWAAPATGSALFHDSVANLWLVDTVSGEITSFSHGEWIRNYSDVESDFPVDSNYEALVNSLPNSSTPMSLDQPGVAIIGLTEADRVLGEHKGPNPLRVIPAGGYFTETIGLRLQVEPRQLDAGDLDLEWTIGHPVHEDVKGSRILTANERDRFGPDYMEQSLYLVRDGAHTVSVVLRDADNNGIVDSVNRLYTLASTHPDGERRDTDGDGIPDLVEKALGLNPLEPDADAPSHVDGWSRFDLWMRCTAEHVDDCHEPEDRDKDGWTDFDENLRGTRPDDATDLTFDDGPEPGSESERQLRQRYKEFPSARRLYEIEWELRSAALGLPVDELQAATLYGEDGWHLSGLLTDEDLSNAGLTKDGVADSRLRSLAEQNLKAEQWPIMRLPAGDPVVVRGSRVTESEDGKMREVYLLLLPSQADLTPRGFDPDLAGEWNTVGEWRDAYNQWLDDTLVQSPSAAFSDKDNLPLLVLEQLIAQEAKLREGASLQRLGVTGARLGWLRDFNTVLKARHSDQTLTDMVPRLAKVLGTEGVMEQDAATLQGWLADLPPGTDSSRWLQQQLADDKNLAYRLRLMLLEEGPNQLAADSTLASAAADSDNDGLTNAQEIALVPYRFHTLPWQADTDGDGQIDSVDPCPLDPHDRCTGHPASNLVTLGEHVEVSKPRDEGLVLLSVQLDRPAVRPVKISYQIMATDADNATDGEDFIAASGEVWIQPGQSAVLVPATVINGGTGDQFRLEVTEVEGANLEGSDHTLVTLTPYLPRYPVAKVMATNLTVNETESIVLDASPSYDPDGTELSFFWQQADGPTADLSAGAFPAFAELTAPHLVGDETLTVEVTVSNEAGQTDLAQVAVLVKAEDDPPEVHFIPTYQMVYRTDRVIPYDDFLGSAITDPEGMELTVDDISQQPRGVLATLQADSLLLDGNAAIPEPLGDQRAINRSISAFGSNGLAFLTARDDVEADHARVKVWQPGTGLQTAYEAERGEALSALMVAPQNNQIVFDRKIDGRRFVTWMVSEDSFDSVAVDNLSPGTSGREINPYSGGVYLCHNDAETWHYLNFSDKASYNLDEPCNPFTQYTLSTPRQVCLLGDDRLVCTDSNSTHPNISQAADLTGYTLQTLTAVKDQLLLMVETADGSATELWTVPPDGTRETLRTWPTGTLNHSLHTEAGQLLGLIALGDSVEMLHWIPGESSFEVLGSDYLNNTGQTYSWVQPPVLVDNLYYWAAATSDTLTGIHSIDPSTRVLNTLTELDPAEADVESAWGFELGQAPWGLILGTQYDDGFCQWQRITESGELRAPYLDQTQCGDGIASASREVHRQLGNSETPSRYIRIGGGDYIGETKLELLISDPGGNATPLPIELTITED